MFFQLFFHLHTHFFNSFFNNYSKHTTLPFTFGLRTDKDGIHAHIRVHISSIHTHFFIHAHIALSFTLTISILLDLVMTIDLTSYTIFPYGTVYHWRDLMQFFWFILHRVDGFHSMFTFEIPKCFQNEKDSFYNYHVSALSY